MVCMPLVLMVIAAMAGCEYGCGGYVWVEGSGGIVWVGGGFLSVVLQGVACVAGD